MRFNDNLKEMVLQGASTAELKAASIKSGMKTLRVSGIVKIMEGMTTPKRSCASPWATEFLGGSWKDPPPIANCDGAPHPKSGRRRRPIWFVER